MVFVIWLALGRFGNIPLGRDDEEPEFRTVSWVAMMFSAGMGIGLMFYGVSEPLTHFVTPPPGTGAAGNTEAVQTAMATTLFHWTLHPWAIYAVVGIAIAYGVFRKGRLQLISSAFAPLHRPARAARARRQGHRHARDLRDAVRLGRLARPRRPADRQRACEIVGGIGKVGNGVLVGVIAVLTVAFVASAVSGVAKGIQWLSNINMVLALVLALFVFVVGPTVFILDLVPTALGSYFARPRDDVGPHRGRRRRRRGRVAVGLDGLLLGVVDLLDAVRRHVHRAHLPRPHDPPVRHRRAAGAEPGQPGLVRHLRWRRDQPPAGRHRPRRAGEPEGQLFGLLDQLPARHRDLDLVMVLVAIFFVSGADAASIVMGTLSERGTLEPEPPDRRSSGASPPVPSPR